MMAHEFKQVRERERDENREARFFVYIILI